MTYTTTKALLATVIILATSNTTAANLYQPGSVASMMFEVVSPVVGQQVTPIFLISDKPDELPKSLDASAVAKAGVREDTLSYYTKNLRPDLTRYGINGYAMGGYAVPGNESANKTCAIVLSGYKQMQTTSIMFHESVHCKNFAEMRADPSAWKIAASMNKPWLGMTENQYMSLYHEVLAAYIQVAYSANQGIQDGLGMVIGASRPDKNTATSIGFRTARNAIKRCSVKDACSTDSVAVTRMLASSLADRADMLLDLKELHEAAVASGYVVENK